MKKFLAMMLALLMVLSLAACGGNKDAAGDQPAEITGPEPVGNRVERLWRG